jgi:hypothetical protein
MLKNDLILRNPLRLMGQDAEELLGTGQFGAVLARAGVGKTAFLVQLALNEMLREKNVLHISLEDPVNKVSLWYQEVFRNIAREYAVDQTNTLWDALLPHRFIMTFRVERFSVPKLQERLTDLTSQGIFTPQMIIVDGLPFDEHVRPMLNDLKNLARDHRTHAWFAILTHRHEQPPDGELPKQLSGLEDLFTAAVQLFPTGKSIQIVPLIGGPPNPPDLFLDATTMLIKKGHGRETE